MGLIMIKRRILAIFLFLFSCCVSAQYIEVGPSSGAVTDSSATIIYKISLPHQKCRVEYADNASFDKSEFSASYITSGSQANYIKVVLKNLKPEKKYHYRLELNGERVIGSQGSFKTFAPTNKSFTIAFGNSLKSESKRSGLRASIDEDILFFLNTGDIHYDNIDTADIGQFRNSYQKAFLRKDMKYMGKRTPLVFVWDDHDYGDNNSDKTAPGRLQSGQAYRECIPHYPLKSKEKNGPIYQAFTVNNTRFVITDLRSKRDPNKKPDNHEKSMMGIEQRKWFLNEIKESASKYPFVIWVSTVPFTAEKDKGEDDWGGFTYERKIISNFIKENNIDNLMIISGDSHAVLYNIGDNNNYSDYEGSGLFEVIASPLDNWATSVKGGPWTNVYRPKDGELVYGKLEVNYIKDKVSVHFKAFNINDKLLVEAKKTYDNNANGY